MSVSTIQAPLSTLKQVKGIPGLPKETFSAQQNGRANDGDIVVHGVRVGDTIIAAVDMQTGTDLLSKFTSPATVADRIAQSDSNADHSNAQVFFVIQRG